MELSVGRKNKKQGGSDFIQEGNSVYSIRHLPRETLNPFKIQVLDSQYRFGVITGITTGYKTYTETF